MYVCKYCENILKKCMYLENGYMHFLHAYGVVRVRADLHHIIKFCIIGIEVKLDAKNL